VYVRFSSQFVEPSYHGRWRHGEWSHITWGSNGLNSPQVSRSKTYPDRPFSAISARWARSPLTSAIGIKPPRRQTA